MIPCCWHQGERVGNYYVGSAGLSSALKVREGVVIHQALLPFPGRSILLQLNSFFLFVSLCGLLKV
jgi:hypothetical protein